MFDALVEGKFGIFDFDGDRSDCEAVGGGERAAEGVVEGGDGGGGCCGGDRRRVRGGEEKFEVAGTEEIGGVSIISGGEVGFGDDRHAETPRKPAG